MSAVERAPGPGEIERHEPEHPHERPEDWGWNADLGRLARVGGWFSVIVLALGLTATRYNNAGTVAILICLGLIVLGLLIDRQRRRTAYRR